MSHQGTELWITTAFSSITICLFVAGIVYALTV